MPSSWREQYDRMQRWYDRFARINQGYKHDSPAENSADETFAFFQNCYHLKDWIKNDSNLPSDVRQSVEPFVNDTRSLKVCGDLTNTLKHFERKMNKSGEAPTFAPRVYSFSLPYSTLSI